MVRQNALHVVKKKWWICNTVLSTIQTLPRLESDSFIMVLLVFGLVK